MIFKFLAFAVVLFVIYIVMFRKKRIQGKDDNDTIDTMIQCPKCNTYILKDDAILSNGRYFCSKECL